MFCRTQLHRPARSARGLYLGDDYRGADFDEFHTVALDDLPPQAQIRGRCQGPDVFQTKATCQGFHTTAHGTILA